MAFPISSILGASFTSSNTTALFALNQKALGSDNSEFQYVIATGTLVTGQCVYINTAGTAAALSTAQLASSVTGALDLGFAQFQMLQGEFGFVAKRGTNMYVLCSGTVPGGIDVGFAAEGVLVTSLLVGVSMTAAGIFVSTSASTAGRSTATAILTYPRPLVGHPQA